MSLQEDLDWYRSQPAAVEFIVEEAKLDFAVSLNRAVEHQGMLRRELADALGTSPAYITKVMRGDANLTIESMVKLAYHAEGALHIHISPRGAGVRWFEVYAATPHNLEDGKTWATTQSGRGNERIVMAA